MNWFRWRSKSFSISECDPSYKVKYLGNVLTTFVRGEGCVDRPLTMIWNNYLANRAACVDMQLTVTNSGLNAVTKTRNVPNQQNAADCVTEYRCHRICYCLHHPQYPKLFIWVYRHDGRKMKVEARCHAVLCKSEAKAKAIHAQLRQRVSFALAEYAREKTRRQNSRLVVQRTRSVPAGVGGIALPVRTQLLRQGQHFKPLTSNSNNAPHLCVISEELDETEGSFSAGNNRLSWQQPPTLREDEKSDVACGFASSAAGDLRNRGGGSGGGEGHVDDDDDSVFHFNPPTSLDLRLSDDFRSFSENGNGAESPSRSDYVCLVPSVNLHPDPSFIRASEAPAAAESEAVIAASYPSYSRALSENELDMCRPTWERTDPEGMEGTSKVTECDDQSIESGFSEQDAHDV